MTFWVHYMYALYEAIWARDEQWDSDDDEDGEGTADHRLPGFDLKVR